MADVRKRIIFHGRVQGVGFRYTAKRYALGFGLTGWIKNECNGTVVMEIQGSERFINQLLVEINRNRYIQIDWIDSEMIPLGDENSFSIR